MGRRLAAESRQSRTVRSTHHRHARRRPFGVFSGTRNVGLRFHAAGVFWFTGPRIGKPLTPVCQWALEEMFSQPGDS